MVYFVTFLLYAFVFVIGAVIGSFLNVVACRVPAGVSFVKGRSRCPGCGGQLKGYDMIPIVSYLFLRGKCRFCGRHISLRYPLVEIVTGGLAVLLTVHYGFTLRALTACLLFALLIPVFLIDLDTMTIPNGLVLALLIPAVMACFFFPEVTLVSRLAGAVVISLPMYLLTLAIPDCFGGGDIKLMAACGLALGWRSTLFAAFLAIITGGVYCIILLARKKKGRKAHIAFGPFLTVGVAAAFLYGQQAVDWYLGLFAL